MHVVRGPKGNSGSLGLRQLETRSDVLGFKSTIETADPAHREPARRYRGRVRDREGWGADEALDHEEYVNEPVSHPMASPTLTSI